MSTDGDTQNHSNDVTPSSSSLAGSINYGDEKEAVIDGKVDLEQVDLALPAKLGRSSLTRWLSRTCFSLYLTSSTCSVGGIEPNG